MKASLTLEFVARTMHFIQSVTLLHHGHLKYSNSSVVQEWKEKCDGRGERALQKFRSNLERKDWTLEGDFEEGIVVKSVFDRDTETHFLLTEAQLDFESDWLFRELQGNALEAIADWYSDVAEYKILRRPTADCWVAYQVTEPKLGGLFYSRDMVVLTLARKGRDANFFAFASTDWPGMEPKGNIIRAVMQEGGGISLSPNPGRRATRTVLRWVSSLDFKVPVVPLWILRKLYVEGCRNYVRGLREYLSYRRRL